VTAAPLPAEVAAEVTSAYEPLGARPVAVRSSATLEDSVEASFAGL
jgi:phosphoenolpyruvate synthase/pyruvate phosphate dikinase